MTFETSRRAPFLLALFGFVAPLTTLCAQDDLLLPPTPDPSVGLTPDDGVEPEVLSRGPVHEAFAEQYNKDPQPGMIVDRQPPEPIDELPPETMPEGNNVEWVPGYFAWDDDLNDFIWVSGLWRDIPPGQRWVPGYWNPTQDGHYQWISGFWASEQTAELDYLPYPPQSLEQGPNVASPGDNYFWVPGCWVQQDYAYRWRPGYWQPCYDDWVWIPDRYVWTPYGAVFCPGYWDYRLPYRGTLFAPVRFASLGLWRQRYPYYSPGITIGLSNLTLHLFVRPNYCHYYFGDFYGNRYAGFGIQPWYLWGGRGYYDPLLTFYNGYHRRHYGINFAGRLASWHHYYRDHDDFRPRRTFRDQRNFAQHHHNDIRARQSVLAQPLNQVAQSGDHQHRFRHIDAGERQQQSQSGRRMRDLASLRQSREGGHHGGPVSIGGRGDHHGNLLSPGGQRGPGRDSAQHDGGGGHQRQSSLALPKVEHQHGQHPRPDNVPDATAVPARPGHGQPHAPQGGEPAIRSADRRNSGRDSGHGSHGQPRGPQLQPQPQGSPQAQPPGTSRGNRGSSSQNHGNAPSHQQQPQRRPQAQPPASSHGSSSRGRSSGSSGSARPQQPQPHAVPQTPPPASSHGGSSRGRSSGSSGSARAQQPQPHAVPQTPPPASSHGGSSRGRSSGTSGSARPQQQQPHRAPQTLPTASSHGGSSSGRLSVPDVGPRTQQPHAAPRHQSQQQLHTAPQHQSLAVPQHPVPQHPAPQHQSHAAPQRQSAPHNSPQPPSRSAPTQSRSRAATSHTSRSHSASSSASRSRAPAQTNHGRQNGGSSAARHSNSGSHPAPSHGHGKPKNDRHGHH